jgi:ABC-2 type transport system permease protein
VWQLLAAAAVQLPALWLVAGLTVALYGVAPRAVAASWLVPGYALFVGMFGGLVGLPGWTLDLSPFTLVPLLPVDDFALLPIVGLTLAAGALAALGAVGFSRRDLR